MSVPIKENPNQYWDIFFVGERRSEREAVKDRKKTSCMHCAPLGYKNPHRSRAVGTACLPHRPPLLSLRASESFGSGGVAYSLGRKWDVFSQGSNAI